MYARKSARPRKPLNGERLHELALFYLGKFATTRAKLSTYLNRKVRERGWEGEGPPEIERLVERLAASGLIDDAAYALSKSRSLSERGYGASRVRQSLRMAGVEEEDVQHLVMDDYAEAARPGKRFSKRLNSLSAFDPIPKERCASRESGW